jgi:UDPglucose 6-dehydrogenase
MDGYQTEKDVCNAVLCSSISFICVQTPVAKGVPDLSFMEDAIVSVGKILERKTDYHLVVVRSTLLPGTTRKILIPLLQSHCDSRYPDNCGVCFNPEFLREVSALEDFMNPSRIVIGSQDNKSGEMLEAVYSTMKALTIRTDFDTAEMIKCVSNAFLATKISFFNEIYILCRRLGIDDKVVSEALSLDPRIGKYGTLGGRPFSGSCLPKDLAAFARFVRSQNVNPDILKIVMQINSELAGPSE